MLQSALQYMKRQCLPDSMGFLLIGIGSNVKTVIHQLNPINLSIFARIQTDPILQRIVGYGIAVLCVTVSGIIGLPAARSEQEQGTEYK